MKALSGITVIDLTTGISGPYCSMMMADLGAEVIKIEQLGQGDTIRETSPKVNGAAPVFTAYNRNKKSMALDLTQDKSMEIIRGLLHHADILIDNYAPGEIEKLGLDYASLKETYPRLICTSHTGFGTEGPYRNRPVYEGTFQAECGMTQSLINDSFGTPYLVGGNMAQYMAAHFCLVATLAALHQRQDTGRGQKVESNIYNSFLAIFPLPINDYLFNGVECPVDGNAPQGFVRSKDGWLRISCGDQPIWERTVSVFNDPIMNEPRFHDAAVRNENRALMLERVELWSSQYTSEEAVQLFAKYGIPGGVVRTMKDLKEDPHLLARNNIVEIEVAGAGKLPYFASPFRMEGSPIEYNPAPALGEHSQEILAKYLNMDIEQLKNLEQTHILG